MDDSYFKREFHCVQYPAVVKNVNKAIETLGGIAAISKVVLDKGKLDINFRPDNILSKTAFSNVYENADILIKLVIKKKKKRGVVVSTVVSSEFLGVVSTIHKFENLMDYQYLPMIPANGGNEPSNRLECIYDQLIPSGFPSVDWLNALAPQFFVPRFFSRMDHPYNYAFRSNVTVENSNVNTNTDVILRTRKQRITYAIYVSFNQNEPTPEKPNSCALGLLHATKKDYDTIKSLYDSQPIWSKCALLCQSKVKSSSLKTILPCLAYYYVNGPWRLLWVRFGYDPRKDFHCRNYQLLEFRQKRIYSGIVTAKESITTNMHSKIISSRRRPIKETVEDKYDRLTFYRPGIIPPYTNMFYQYCNIKVPEIEEMLEKLGDVHPGALCHEKRGWLPAGFDEQCRDIMTSYLVEKLRELAAENKMQSQYKDLEGTLEETLDDDLDIEGDDDGEDAPSEYEYEDIEDDGENVFEDTADVDEDKNL